MSNTPNTLSPELQQQIEKEAESKYRGRPDNYFPSNHKLVEGYIDGRSETAIKLQQAEQMMEKMAAYLRIIENPIEHLRKEAEREGGQLDGAYAWQIANDANYLRGQAMGALGEYNTYIKQSKDASKCKED